MRSSPSLWPHTRKHSLAFMNSVPSFWRLQGVGRQVQGKRTEGQHGNEENRDVHVRLHDRLLRFQQILQWLGVAVGLESRRTVRQLLEHRRLRRWWGKRVVVISKREEVGYR